MSPENAAGPEAGSLQFDQAEYATPEAPAKASCALCKREIVDAYFESGGKLICAPCREQVEASLRGGSRWKRAVKATILGTIAAIAGAVLYYTITKITGYNLGIVSVVVGVMVGGAVRAGSGHRGGAFYQLLAVFLTYSAIVAMLSPDVFEAVRDRARKEKGAVPARNDPAPAGALPKPAGDQAQAQARPARVAPAAGAKPPAMATVAKLPRGAKLLLALAFLALFLYAVPIMVGISSPISLLIFGFAVWEAWKLNRRVRLVFHGPYRIGDGLPLPAAGGGDGRS